MRPDRGETGQRPEDRGQEAATRHQAEGRGGCASGAESGAPLPGAGPTQARAGSAHAGTGHGAAGAEAPGGAVLQGPAEIDPSATRPEGRAQVRAEAAPEGPGAGGQRGRCAAAGGLPDVSRGDRARAGRGPRPGRDRPARPRDAVSGPHRPLCRVRHPSPRPASQPDVGGDRGQRPRRSAPRPWPSRRS